MRLRYVLHLFVFCSVASCSEYSDPESDIQIRLLRILDSLKPVKVITAYTHDSGFSLIFQSTNKDSVIKYTRRKNFPILIDTLTQLSPGLFRSNRYRFLYVVNKHSVSEIFLRKIVHPSSNWQGQTPGQDSVITIYRRIDTNSE